MLPCQCPLSLLQQPTRAIRKGRSVASGMITFAEWQLSWRQGGSSPRVQPVGSANKEPRVHESIQQAGACRVVEAPEPRRLGEGETELGHLDVLTSNTLEQVVNHYRVPNMRRSPVM